MFVIGGIMCSGNDILGDVSMVVLYFLDIIKVGEYF